MDSLAASLSDDGGVSGTPPMAVFIPFDQGLPPEREGDRIFLPACPPETPNEDGMYFGVSSICRCPVWPEDHWQTPGDTHIHISMNPGDHLIRRLPDNGTPPGFNTANVHAEQAAG